jgi:hypothetical protein
MVKSSTWLPAHISCDRVIIICLKKINSEFFCPPGRCRISKPQALIDHVIFYNNAIYDADHQMVITIKKSLNCVLTMSAEQTHIVQEKFRKKVHFIFLVYCAASAILRMPRASCIWLGAARDLVMWRVTPCTHQTRLSSLANRGEESALCWIQFYCVWSMTMNYRKVHSAHVMRRGNRHGKKTHSQSHAPNLAKNARVHILHEIKATKQKCCCFHSNIRLKCFRRRWLFF